MAVRVNEMKYDSNLLLIVDSSRLGGRFECHRFREYNIDIDLEADTATWDFVFRNPDSVYTSLFSRHDPIFIQLNKFDMLWGRVDKVEYQWDDDDNIIRVSGRDLAAPLVDNDAIPATKQNVKPDDYIREICSQYRIPKINLSPNISITDKLIIGTGESEISVIRNLVTEDRKRVWFLIDTFYAGDWNTSMEPSYLFTRGVPIDKQGIPIKSLRLIEDGTTEISEMIIYGSMNSGENKVVGTAKNDQLISRGIQRRHTRRAHNNDAATKYASNALRDVRDGFRDNTTVEITIKTPEKLILPNRTARIIDTVTRINSTFFIRGVTYSKDLTSGSEATITMVLGDSTFEVLWSGQGTKNNGGVTGFAKDTQADVINNIKG